MNATHRMSAVQRTTMRAVALGAAAGLALGGCSSDAGTPLDSEVGTDTEETSTVDSEEAAMTMPVTGFEYGYDLGSTEIAAGTYTFDFSNVGSMQHDLRIEGGGLDDGTAVIGPGETDSLTVTLEPGTYTIYCSVGNHRAQGMEVEITVS